MKYSRILSNVLAAVALTSAGVAAAHEAPAQGGYLVDSRGNVVRNSYNQCWHSGTWTAEKAIADCEPDLIKKEEPKVEVPPPAPAPAPAPEPVPEPVKPPPVSVSLQAETLFGFNNAILTDEGKKILDSEVVAKMKQFQQIEAVQVTGHADRIGSEPNNKKVAKARADAVKAYLVSQGIEAGRVSTADKGSSEPVAKCDDVKGRAVARNKKLVKCLQPNRRVVVEVKGLR